MAGNRYPLAGSYFHQVSMNSDCELGTLGILTDKAKMVARFPSYDVIELLGSNQDHATQY